VVVKYVIWGILIGSSLLLLFQLFRLKRTAKWLSALGINIVFSALMLYALNWLTPYTHVTMPINFITLAVAGLLGIPGILLLISIKIVLL
jgi:inhibitor of the pro-sigma K processing machinery